MCTSVKWNYRFSPRPPCTALVGRTRVASCKTAGHSRGEAWPLLLLLPLQNFVRSVTCLVSVYLQARSSINPSSFAGVTFKGRVPLAHWERDPEIQLCVSCMERGVGQGAGGAGTGHCQGSCSPGKGLGTCPLLRGRLLAALGTVGQSVTSLPARFLPLGSWPRGPGLRGSREVRPRRLVLCSGGTLAA